MLTAKFGGEAVGLCTIVRIKAGSVGHLRVSKELKGETRQFYLRNCQRDWGNDLLFGLGWRKCERGSYRLSLLSGEAKRCLGVRRILQGRPRAFYAKERC
jgi:hypothetical protein